VAVERVGVSICGAAFLLTGALALLAVLLFGTLPAWWASSADALSGLRSRTGRQTSGSGRDVRLAVQVALSLMLPDSSCVRSSSIADRSRVRPGSRGRGVGPARTSWLTVPGRDAPGEKAGVGRIRATVVGVVRQTLYDDLTGRRPDQPR